MALVIGLALLLLQCSHACIATTMTTTVATTTPLLPSAFGDIYIYIYMYIKREREREIEIHT